MALKRSLTLLYHQHISLTVVRIPIGRRANPWSHTYPVKIFRALAVQASLNFARVDFVFLQSIWEWRSVTCHSCSPLYLGFLSPAGDSACIWKKGANIHTPIPFLSFIVPIFAWSVPLVSLIFLKISVVFPILLFSSISLHWSRKKAFLSLLAIVWNSAFKWVYLSFSPLPFASFLSYL